MSHFVIVGVACFNAGVVISYAATSWLWRRKFENYKLDEIERRLTPKTREVPGVGAFDMGSTFTVPKTDGKVTITMVGGGGGGGSRNARAEYGGPGGEGGGCSSDG